ncbi:prolipoprotein diacylglyceryl transferase [Actinoplanes sp. N902-109]|nr:prolipoprotein diacylglyceryl transferase [Actinoplanes sp. N902-109]
MNYAAIPSPTTSVWHVLGIPVRAYALCIVAGIVVAVLIMEHRLRRRGVAPWASLDMAVWAVPFGIVGARIYHVITSPSEYFGADGHPLRIFQIWEGGLGIWGAVAGGALGAWFAARQLGLPLSVFADALAPGLPVAQAVGRFGNWFNNELYGKVTTLPWGLRVHDMDRSNPGHATVIDGKAVTLPDLYHPTFLYEAVWDVGVGVLVWLLDRRYKFGRGRAFALYVMAYTLGRCWIEMLRIDDANHFFGIRLNVFTAIVVFLAALAYFLLVKGPRQYVVPIDAAQSADAPRSEDPQPGSDVNQVDVAATPAPTPTAPRAYQVVSEQRFQTYERTGILPPADEEPAPVEEPAALAPAGVTAAAGSSAAAGSTAGAGSSATTPSATTPSATTPSATTPSATTPSATTPSATTPSATTPSATTPSAAMPSADGPAAGQPAVEQPGQPAVEQAGRPAAEQAGRPAAGNAGEAGAGNVAQPVAEEAAGRPEGAAGRPEGAAGRPEGAAGESQPGQQPAGSAAADEPGSSSADQR